MVRPMYLQQQRAAFMGGLGVQDISAMGAMELGRSLHSYDRAIERLRTRIWKLKQKRRSANKIKLKGRRRRVRRRYQRRITRLRAKMKKLQAYRKLKAKRIAEKKGTGDELLFADEDLLLEEAFAPDILADAPMGQDNVDTISFGEDDTDMGMEWWQIGLIVLGGITIAAITAKALKKSKRKPRKNRYKVGKRKNPKSRRKTYKRKTYKRKK